MRWDVGYHPAFEGSIHDCILKAIKYGCLAIQFFLGNPKTVKKRHVASFEDISKTKRLLSRFPTHVFSHFPYVGSLLGCVTQLAWAGDEEQDRKTQQVLKSLEYELSILSNFDGLSCGVVIHPGSYRGHLKAKKNLVVPPDMIDDALRTIAESINRINFTDGGKLLLENCAGQGTTLPRTFAQLKTIIDYVDDEHRPHVGVCVDTAHIWGVGEYDLSKCSEVKRMFQEFEDTIGMEYFSLLHLNDSEVELGTNKDRHACLGTGYIWGKSFDSLTLLLDTCKSHGIPMILETHGMDMITLACL